MYKNASFGIIFFGVVSSEVVRRKIEGGLKEAQFVHEGRRIRRDAKNILVFSAALCVVAGVGLLEAKSRGDRSNFHEYPPKQRTEKRVHVDQYAEKAAAAKVDREADQEDGEDIDQEDDSE